MKKIAFCFLIYDTINHEELWNNFFKNVDPAKYNIYIHYKYNKQLTYFEKYKITNSIETKYADHTLALAYNVLFRNAYTDDTDNYKFVILSNSCVPLKTFDHIYDKLTGDDYGYLTVCPQTQCFPNCDSLLEFTEKKHISKANNWFILNRKLVKNLCFDKDEIIKTHYKEIYAAEEYFFYTYIRILGLEDQVKTTSHMNIIDATTFVNWEGDGYKYPSVRGLHNYNYISDEELSYILNSKCLFGRKFTPNCISLYNSMYIESIM